MVGGMECLVGVLTCDTILTALFIRLLVGEEDFGDDVVLGNSNSTLGNSDSISNFGGFDNSTFGKFSSFGIVLIIDFGVVKGDNDVGVLFWDVMFCLFIKWDCDSPDIGDVYGGSISATTWLLVLFVL